MRGCGTTRPLGCLWRRAMIKRRIQHWRPCGPQAARWLQEFHTIIERHLRRDWESLTRRTLPQLAHFALALVFITTIWRRTDGWTRLPRSIISICRMEAGRAR